MKIRIKYPDNYKKEQVLLFQVESNGKLEKTGYRVGTTELISMQKKDGYLYVEINNDVESEIENTDGRGNQ